MTHNQESTSARTSAPHVSTARVFLAFLQLGFTSFGGPVAHLGYFRDAFVERRRWIDERIYADLVALCQFLPGPASSQVGLAIGLAKAGLPGAFAAWFGFTMPSAIALCAFGYGVGAFHDAIPQGVLQGLKVVAVAVVAQAVWAMARTLCPDARRLTLAVAAAIGVLAIPTPFAQIGVIVVGAIVGTLMLPSTDDSERVSLDIAVDRGLAIGSLVLFFALLAALPLLAAAIQSHALALIDGFYRSGSLVFGGGHVVPPLLHSEVVPPGWVMDDAFLAGYGAAQAVPGPLFTFAYYLGTVAEPAPNGWLGAIICLLAIFAPSFLLVIGVLPFWDALRHMRLVKKALLGVNAAVVGLLIAAPWSCEIRRSRAERDDTDRDTEVRLPAQSQYHAILLASWLSSILLLIPAASAIGDPMLADGAECHANSDCVSRSCSPYPLGRHYCRASEKDCAEPEAEGLLDGYTTTVDGRTWMCRQGGRWQSSPKRANGAECKDDSQCASQRCRPNPDGNHYCLAESLDCSDSRMNGVPAGYTMQILDESWTCTRNSGWGAARFSDFSDGIGTDRVCRVPKCAPGDDGCNVRRNSKLRYCERLKAIEIELAEPVSLAIAEGRDAAERAGVKGIPDEIRARLDTFFAPELLSKVRYRVGMPGDSEILRFAFGWLRTSAFVMDYVIIFRDEQDALNNVRLWAHELEHVIQYEILGIDGFAQRWIQSAKRGVYDEDKTTIEGAATARAIYVCSHISC